MERNFLEKEIVRYVGHVCVCVCVVFATNY